MTVTTSRPPIDAQQDYNMTSSEERAGYTKLTFHRKRNTGDDKDIEIKVVLHAVLPFMSFIINRILQNP